MPTAVQFGSLDTANEARDLPAVQPHLAPSDDRRSLTVQLSTSAPQRVVERLENMAFSSQSGRTETSAELADLSESERRSLRSTGRFDWNQHGFEAMRAKATLKEKGVTEWQDFYEPGEGAASALGELQRSKKQGMQSRARIGVEADRTDEEERSGGGRRRRQAEQATAQRVDSAKEPAILDRDASAQDFLDEEQDFGGEPWDISYGETDRYGRAVATGPDAELLRERNQQRSERARAMDDRRVAERTRDPVTWANNPGEYDYPGIDTVEPDKKHASRSTRARERDEAELAPLASHPAEWAADMDDTDLTGIDTPQTERRQDTADLPAPERNTDAPEPDVAELAERDLSLAPEEAFEGVGAASQESSARPGLMRQLAGDVEADMAFDRAERERMGRR